MTLTRIFLTTAWMLPAILTSAAEPPMIVKDGQALAQIVIAAHPTRSARLAAKELQHYVQKISGASLPVVTSPSDAAAVKILIGDSDALRAKGVTTAGLPRDAFRIVSGDGWLALAGDDMDFQPIEPWGRGGSDWKKNREAVCTPATSQKDSRSR